MTYPSIGNITASGTTGNQTSFTATLPSSIVAGQLLLLLCASDTASRTFSATGWTGTGAFSSAGGSFELLYKIATGTEGASVSVSIVGGTGSNPRAGAISVNGAHQTAAPEITTLAAGSSVSPAPPSITASWGSDTNLFIAYENNANSTHTVSAYPTNYTLNNTTISGGINDNFGFAARQLTSATDSPGVFTLSTTSAWAALTLVIRPQPSATTSTGTSSASSVVGGVGAATNATSASTSATSAVSGVGAATAASVGSVSAASSVSGVGAGTDAATGTIASTSALSGVGASVAAASGSISAASTVSGIAAQIIGAVGTIVASSDVEAVSTTIVADNTQGDGEDRRRKRQHVSQRRLRPIYAQPEPKVETPKRQKECLPSADELRALLLGVPVEMLPPIGDAPNYALLQYAKPVDNAAELAQLAANRALAIRRFQDEEDVAIALLLAS